MHELDFKTGNCLVTFRKDIPGTISQIIASDVARSSKVFPSWLRVLRVAFNPEENDCIATSYPSYEYRKLEIHIHPDWLSLSSAERISCIVHEIIHAYLSPMQQIAEKIIEHLDLDDATRSIIADEWRMALESSTNDLEYLIADIIEL